VGFGCVLIQTEILRRMDKPWFHWSEHKAMVGCSEDFFFCKRAKDNCRIAKRNNSYFETIDGGFFI